MRFLIVMFLIGAALPVRSETKCSDDLNHGRFQKILQRGDQVSPGERAWARFYLVSDFGTYADAGKAHKAGDILGSFVMLKCHRGGVGVKKDDRLKWKLNFDIRTQLEKIEKPNGIEHYMLAFLLPGDESGVDADADPDDLLGGAFKSRNSRWFHLNASANAGFAQAMDEVGLAMQQHNEPLAFDWYKKAANAGLASGMKNLGFFYAASRDFGDPNKAVEWTEKSAEAGNNRGMINMAGFFEKKIFDSVTQHQAQHWVNRAQESGHSLGRLEKALAFLNGSYGFAVNREAGMALLQQAADSGDAVSLSQISTFYAQGKGLDYRPDKAIEFAEAAFRQGDVAAADKLSGMYASVAGTNPVLKEKAIYWESRALSDSNAFAMKLDREFPEIVNAVQAIDPHALIVD